MHLIAINLTLTMIPPLGQSGMADMVELPSRGRDEIPAETPIIDPGIMGRTATCTSFLFISLSNMIAQ